MLMRQDDIPEGLVAALEKNPEVLDESVPLTDEALKAAVESVKEVEKADLVSSGV